MGIERKIVATSRLLTNSTTLDASNTSKSYNIFQVVGSVYVSQLVGEVTTVLSANHTDCHCLLYSTSASEVISKATTLTLSAAPAESVLIKNAAATSTLQYLAADQPRVSTPAAANLDEFVAVEDPAATTYIQFRHTTTDTPSSGVIKWYVYWIALTTGALLKAV
jgi:hypothetical protein